MKNVKNEPKKVGSGVPLAIIVLVLVVAVGGGWWLYNSSQSSTKVKSNNSAANTNRGSKTLANAPPGAQPANILGSATAQVTIEEFADFQCGSCAAAHPVLKEIQSVYGPRIKFVFRNFPLSIPGHDKAFDAAVAAEAAGIQGKFWQRIESKKI
ncbi:MAG: DsbA family protein [Acidobacteria bacterium]|nr:DsbA family protein [Acidobacteriota bacterium]